ncbi:MAG: PD-(D/E)XK nuclease family protein, partial [Clostridium sp.]
YPCVPKQNRYPACTQRHAQHSGQHLKFCGSCGRTTEKSIEKWSGASLNDENRVKTTYVKNQKSYLDWIGAALINHRDGEALRHYKDNLVKEDFIEDNSKFTVKIYQRSEFEGIEAVDSKDNNAREKIEALLKDDEDCENKKYDDIIQNRLEFKYDYEKATVMPTVITVTELKEAHIKGNQLNNALMDEESSMNAPQDISKDEEDLQNIFVEEERLFDEEKRDVRRSKPLMKTPLFLQEKKGLTPSEVGTAYHNIMEKLTLEEEMTSENIADQISVMVEKELITKEAAKSVKVDKIFKFVSSEMGGKVIKAHLEKNLKRELPFRVEIDAATIYPHLDKEKYCEEKMLLRGVIDCYFEEGEEGIILDYKTDYVKEENIEEIKDRYKVQLDYYSKAVQDAFKKTKVRKYLYLFSLDRAVEVE